MPTSLTFKDLQTAIEQLRPELPSLLGADSSAFETELDTCLNMGSVIHLLSLFGRYSVAHDRLLDVLALPEEEKTKGIGLYGKENISLPYLYYYCKSGADVLVLRKVEKRDAAGNALCLEHSTVMSRISSQELRAAMEQLRPELPQLLGTNDAAFVMKLDTLLQAGGTDDQLSQLFADSLTAQQRLLQILAEKKRTV